MKSLWSNQDRGKRGAVEQLKYHRLLSEKSLKIIVAGLLLNISLSPVYAETGATQLEPITVIGEKVARSIQDTVSRSLSENRESTAEKLKLARLFHYFR